MHYEWNFPLNVRHLEYYQGVNASHWLGPYAVNILIYDKLRLRQNHRKNQEVGLLYSLYSVARLPASELHIYLEREFQSFGEAKMAAIDVQ